MSRSLQSSLWLVCLLGFIWFSMEACGGGNEPKACNNNTECPADQVCISKTCQSKPDASTRPEPGPEPAKEPVVEQGPDLTPEPLPEKPEDRTPPPPDEDTTCSPGSKRLCYTGPEGTRGVGNCFPGRQTCLINKTWNPACVGEVTPKAEACNNKDDDCDGTVDEDATCDECTECKAGVCVLKAGIAPKLTSLDPNSVIPTTFVSIEAKGTCFDKADQVLFDGKPVSQVSFVDRTQFDFTLDLSMTPPGKYKVVIKSSTGVESNALELEVKPAPCAATVPRITSFTPTIGTSGTSINFQVNGGGFLPTSKIIFDGKVIATQYVNSIQLRANPQLDLTMFQAGNYKVQVDNDNNCISTEVDFPVLDQNAVPQITAITPNTVDIGKSNKLVITGKNFLPSPSFNIGLNSITGVVYNNTTQITVTFTPATGVWTPGTQQAYILNSNGKQSNTLPLTFK